MSHFESDMLFLFTFRQLACLQFVVLLSCAGCISRMRHLKVESGAVDARKWSDKWRNWNISDIFFSLISMEGQKQQRRSMCMGTMLLERARQENGFLVLRRII